MGLNDATIFNIQPSMSSNLECVAFIKNANDSWSANDSYITHKELPSVTDPEGTSLFKIYPKPSKGKFFVTLPATENAGKYSVEVFDTTGKSILTNSIRTEIDLTNYTKDIYFIKISGRDFSEVKKIVRY